MDRSFDFLGAPLDIAGDAGDDKGYAVPFEPISPRARQGWPMFADRSVDREALFESSSNMATTDFLVWGHTTEQKTEPAQPSDMMAQPMFGQAGSFVDGQGNGAIMAEGHEVGRAPSRTPEFMRSGRRRRRRPSSFKSEQSPSPKSRPASTELTPPDSGPPRKRARSRKIKKEPSGDERRDLFLERNRIAASKCREKKKQFVSDLEERKIMLEAQHGRLQEEYNQLVASVAWYKHVLFKHSDCKNPNIDAWLEREARKFVQTSDVFGPQRAAAVNAAAAAAAAVATAAGGAQGLLTDAAPPPFPLTHTRNSSASSAPLYGGGGGGGLGSFSSAAGTDAGGARRDSLAAYSQTSVEYSADDMGAAGPVDGATWTAAPSCEPSPRGIVFRPMTPAAFQARGMDGRDQGINFDHMPDEMFAPEK